MLKRGGTRLGVIPNHQLYVECGACDHAAPVAVSDLIARCGPQASVGEIVSKMRCQRCGRKQIKDYRITYAGGSSEALRGAEQQH
ncbi:hypothetical protein KUV26_16985 [Leisingera daeponensis]|uniref:Uncharacterized protein n=1 Tax=Leisingera daeponensis TaxID=405746 RepID=A0ABS7NIU7_9RHOB|nr:hypothetical protein [Leisingera daeponensis]MBY6141134.1 hypothetical protein [Leisingera daeponensis]